jgi:hypothetical protein
MRVKAYLMADSSLGLILKDTWPEIFERRLDRWRNR